MYLFHQRWRKTTPAAHQARQDGVHPAAAAITFEDMQILRDVAPLIGLEVLDIRIIEVLAAAARSGQGNFSARISDGWLASAAAVEREELPAALDRLAAAGLLVLPRPDAMAQPRCANRKTYDLSPMAQRLSEFEWLGEAAACAAGENGIPDYVPDSFRDILEVSDLHLGDEPQDAAIQDHAPALSAGSLQDAMPDSGAASAPNPSFPRKTAPRRGLMRQALSKRLAPRRTPRAPRSGRCPSPAAASPILGKRHSAATSGTSLQGRFLEGLQAWQKALGAVFGIAPSPVPVPVPATLSGPVRPRGYPGMYNDAYWINWNEEKSQSYT